MVHVPLTDTTDSPRVTVLMATFNGRQWIEEQVNSILHQENVIVRLVVSDDGSHDGTREFLEEWAAHEPRITLLPQREGAAGVTENFLHLFTQHESDGSFVAFADQDDRWHHDKLSYQISLIRAYGLDAVSSNVMSFEESGKRKLIRKSQPMRKWDHLFEAAGPGSTYVFTPELHTKLCSVLDILDYSQIAVHDWYVYALARALGARWRIDERPTVDYRQHRNNIQGANLGFSALISRISKLSSGFYGKQFVEVARAVEQCNVYTPEGKKDLAAMIELLEDSGISSRFKFLSRTKHIRRSRVEGLQLSLLRVLGVW